MLDVWQGSEYASDIHCVVSAHAFNPLMYNVPKWSDTLSFWDIIHQRAKMNLLFLMLLVEVFP